MGEIEEEEEKRTLHKRVIEDSDIMVVTRVNRSEAVILLLRCLQSCGENLANGRREELSQRGKNEPQTSHEESRMERTCRRRAAHWASSQSLPLFRESRPQISYFTTFAAHDHKK